MGGIRHLSRACRYRRIRRHRRIKIADRAGHLRASMVRARQQRRIGAVRRSAIRHVQHRARLCRRQCLWHPSRRRNPAQNRARRHIRHLCQRHRPCINRPGHACTRYGDITLVAVRHTARRAHNQTNAARPHLHFTRGAVVPDHPVHRACRITGLPGQNRRVRKRHPPRGGVRTEHIAKRRTIRTDPERSCIRANQTKLGARAEPGFQNHARRIPDSRLVDSGLHPGPGMVKQHSRRVAGKPTRKHLGPGKGLGPRQNRNLTGGIGQGISPRRARGQPR